MDGATQALLDLWDVTDGALAGMGPEDFARPLPGARAEGLADVADLAVHLTGVHYAGPETLRTAVAQARAQAARTLADRPPGDRLLGAQCLDMCLHTHDLTSALDEPVDLAAHADATREASRLLLGLVPRLLVSAVGCREAGLRVEVGDLARSVHVVAGTCVPDDHPADDVLAIDPDAFVLLLAGRADAASLRARGAAWWRGPSAEAFVGRGRLLAQANAG